jgi:2-(1,2-epoxy-1,2-dihydrophenyl)acetyl-CoA isomerase
MTRFEMIELHREGAVAHLVLNRPQAANAVDLTMARELLAAALEIDEDPSVRCVLLRAHGKMFCAGGDLGSFAQAGDGMPALVKEMTISLHAAISRLTRMRAPVVAAVHGAAAGAGFSLVCAADLAVIAESAKMTLAYTRAGLTPDGSSTYFLPRLIGRKRTLELMLTNRTLSAAEALDWGLVNQVVPDDELLPTAETLAATLAAGPTEAFGGVKRLVLHSASQTLESQMELESQAIADAARSHDAQEGIAAFFAKRRADFTGS